MSTLPIATAALAIFLMAACSSPSERKPEGDGSSYEELFMGLHRPFAQRGDGPKPASTPEGTVKALYADEIFFNLRNSFPEAVIKHLGACFTPSLIDHFSRSRREITRWIADKSHANMKLPMGEGGIFQTDNATSFKVGRALIYGDTARVPVKLAYHRDGTHWNSWTDFALLRRSRGVWLLDDLEFDPYTLRSRTSIHH